MNKEQYIFSNHKYICFLTVALNAINEANIPKYTSRFSKKRYSQHQLLALLLLKEYLNCGYRELIEILELTDILQKQLMLKGIPHYSTLCKFSDRINSKILNKLMKSVYRFFPNCPTNKTCIAIDSTGMSITSASYYYSWRTGKQRQDFLKLSIAVDVGNQAIVSCSVTNSLHHDSTIAPSLIRSSYQIKRANCYLLDKGYDSEKIHTLIHDEFGAESIIPVRLWGNKIPNGKYRRQIYTDFPKKKYCMRNLVETTFSVIKRIIGGKVSSKKPRKQIREVKLKCICYLTHRFTKIQRVFNFY